MEKIYYKHWVFLVAACSAGANLFINPSELSLAKAAVLLAIMVASLSLFVYFYVEELHRRRLYRQYRRYYETGNNILNIFFIMDNKELRLFFSGYEFEFLKGLKEDLEAYLLYARASDWERQSALRVHNVLDAYIKDKNYN